MGTQQQNDYLLKLGVPAEAVAKLNDALAGKAPGGSAPCAAPAAPQAANAADTLPAPMKPDCKIVRGQVPGPVNHVLCATHGHVVDIASHMIIARSVDDYKKVAAMKAAADNVKKTADKVAADAKRAQAEADRKHGELEKKRGNMKIDVSLVVTGVYGPRDGLTIGIIAQPDHGDHTGELGVGKFKGLGGGKYIAAASWLPPGGFMEFNVLSDNKQRISFKTIQFPCPPKGFLRLEATERPKTSTLNTSRALETNYSKGATVGINAGVEAGVPGLPSVSVGGSGSKTWTTGGGISDSTGLSDTIIESSGEFDVKVV